MFNESLPMFIGLVNIKHVTNKIKKVLKFAFSGFTIVFIATLFFMTVQDLMTGESSITAEYCAKYGFLASPGCW
jgi:hypothetical protein